MFVAKNLAEKLNKTMERLIIKIKIPPAGSELRFECPFCQKSFSSGKGLGGHKRVHMQAGNSKIHHHGTELQIQEAEKTFLCPICNQSFASEKSLHGHMRKHPDRNWRGMRPPIPIPEVVENGDPLLPVSDAVALGGNNLADRSEGDKQVGRRSRHGKAPMNIPETDDKESISVAYDLMALAKGDFGPKKKKLELSVSSTAGNSGYCSSKKKKPFVLGGGNSFELANPGPEEGSTRGKNSSFVDKGNVHKIPIQKKFVCGICDRPFRSYHALGGHKSHHHNLNLGEDDKSAATAAGSVVAYVEQPQGCSTLVHHQCPICDEIFSTSEALGDHRPRCSGLPPINENQSTIFSFDLNELPPEWTVP